MAGEAFRILASVSVVLLVVGLAAAAGYFGRRYWKQWLPKLERRDTSVGELAMRVDALASQIESLSATVRALAGTNAAQNSHGHHLARDGGGNFAQFIGDLQALTERYSYTQTAGTGPRNQAAQPSPDLTYSTAHGTEEVTPSTLMAWWRASGHETLTECEQSLRRKFGTVDLEVVAPSRLEGEHGDWYIIAVRSRDDRHLLLPRRKESWISGVFSTYFDLKESGNIKEGVRINSIIVPATAKKIHEQWRPLEKGFLSICEQ